MGTLALRELHEAFRIVASSSTPSKRITKSRSFCKNCLFADSFRQRIRRKTQDLGYEENSTTSIRAQSHRQLRTRLGPLGPVHDANVLRGWQEALRMSDPCASVELRWSTASADLLVIGLWRPTVVPEWMPLLPFIHAIAHDRHPGGPQDVRETEPPRRVFLQNRRSRPQ